MSPGIVKQIPELGKIAITVKLIAPVGWIFDSERLTVAAFSVKTPVKGDSISFSLPFIQYLFQSLSHMLIAPSHLHPNDFTLPL